MPLRTSNRSDAQPHHHFAPRAASRDTCLMQGLMQKDVHICNEMTEAVRFSQDSFQVESEKLAKITQRQSWASENSTWRETALPLDYPHRQTIHTDIKLTTHNMPANIERIVQALSDMQASFRGPNPTTVGNAQPSGVANRICLSLTVRRH
jgi:hypothetical protein